MKKVWGLLLFLFLVFPVNSDVFTISKQSGQDLPNLTPPSVSQPVCFTQNKGQWNPEFQFIGNTPFGQIGFGKESIYYHLISSDKNQNQVVTLSLVNADMSQLQGIDTLPYAYHYFIGNNVDTWITNVQNFRKIQYKEVYPGIDLLYFYDKENPKYEFYVKPGVNPNQIQFRVEGGSLSISRDSSTLQMNTESGSLSDTSLQVFTQESRQPIQASFKLVGENIYSFSITDYTAEDAIVIDPILYGTYLGGNSDDAVLGQALDSYGNLVVTGFAKSFDFPTTPGAYDSTLRDATAAFVSKFDANLTTLQFSTFLQGAYFVDDPYTRSYGCEVRLNAENEIIIAGITYCMNFPVTQNAYDTVFNGYKDIFVTKLNASGDTLLYSTFLGGIGEDMIEDLSTVTWNPVALAADGSLYIAINTDSIDFPMTDGSYSHTGPNDAGWQNQIALCHLSSDGSSLLASTFFGGSGQDYCPSIAIDHDGNLVLTACTWSNDLPITDNALYDTLPPEKQCSFVSKFSPDLSSLLFSTYLYPVDYAKNSFVNIAFDNSIYITSTLEYYSYGENLPYSSPERPKASGLITPQAVTPVNPVNNYGIFVFHISENGTVMLDNTQLDGYSYDMVTDTCLDSSGCLYITGYTFSWDFPSTVDAFFPYYTYYGDVFVVRYYPNLETVSFSTTFYGYGFDCATDILVTEDNLVYCSGYTTTSDNFFVLGCNGYNNSPQDGLTGFSFAFTIPTLFPPTPSFNGTPSQDIFTFDWTESSPGTFPIAGYALYRSLNDEPFSSVPYQIILGSSVVTTFDSNLPFSETYRYALRTFDTMGNYSGFSPVFRYDIPKAPTGLHSQSAENGIQLSWTASLTGSSSVFQYWIYRDTAVAFASPTKIGSVTAPTVSYLDLTAQAGQTYYYKVVAVDLYGFQSLRSGICSGTVSVAAPFLIISADIMKKEYSDNDYINFKVYIHNIGGASASNVLLYLDLPDLIGFVSVNGASVVNAGEKRISFSTGSIPRGSFISVDFICQVKGKVEKEEKTSLVLSACCDEKVKSEATIDFIVKVKKNNKGTIGITVTVTNLEQDPETGKRFIRVGESLIISYNISGGVPPYTLTIDWGDGTTTEITIDKYGNMSGTLTHKYDVRGSVHIRIKLEDASGQSKESHLNIDIR